jgi:hypothetical protein
MPLHKDIVTDGNPFDGTTDAGLFDIPQTGGQQIQPALNSVNFHTDGAAVLWSLYKQDPNDADNKILILSDTSQNMAIEGGSLILPVEPNGDAWPLLFESANMAGARGFFCVDYDFLATEG